MPQEVTVKVYEYHELSPEAKARVREQMFNNVRRGEGLGYLDNPLFREAAIVSDKYPDGTPSDQVIAAIVAAVGFYRSDAYVQDCISDGYAVLATKDGILLDELGWGTD